MERDDLLRQHLISLFSESEAHLNFDQAVENIADDPEGKDPQARRIRPGKSWSICVSPSEIS